MSARFTPLSRASAAATSIVLAVGLAALITHPAAAAPAPTAANAVIRSGQLSAEVDLNFPEVNKYQFGLNGVLYGHTGPAPQVQLNGIAYTPAVTSTVSSDHVDYRLQFPAIGVQVTARISVGRDVLNWQVTGITESGALRVSTFAIPGQNLLSARGDQPGATLADATVYRTNYATGPDLDTIKAVSDLPVEATPRLASIAILSTATVAAALVSNSIQSFGNLQVQTTHSAGIKQTGVWSNAWTYRGPDGKVVAKPEEKIVFTGDRNGTGKIDWQDGAIAYREIMPVPTGAAQTKNNVVSQIALNFESQAQNPFIKTLDDIKKVNLLTDGLGQSIELKGYQDQGHDSAHPDYAGHYNQAAGGLPDIRYVVSQAKKYNAIVGVHINDAMASPRANAFRWDNSSDTSRPGYVFGDTNYWLDQTKDLSSGAFAGRIAALVKDVPDLGFIYSDAFFGEDWNAWKESSTVNGHAIPIYTEFPTYLWPAVTWYHDSNEYNNVGINSQILRFIGNSNADAWVQKSQPMLGGEQNTASFMGWHSANSVNKEIAQIFTNNLPTKYLQSFQITNWQADEIDFTGGVKTTMNGNTPQIWKDGALERDGNNLFLPWSASGEQKIYAYSDSNAARTWTLPRTWSGQRQVKLYELTDTGKVKAATIPVRDGKLSIQLKADTPYVLYPQHPLTPRYSSRPASDGSNTGTPVTTNNTARSVNFGAGAIVKDGEFFSHSFSAWKPSSTTGNTEGVQIVTDPNGFQNLRIDGAQDGRVSQQLKDLLPGHTYAASAYVNLTGNRRATLQVSRYGSPSAQAWIDTPPPPENDQNNQLFDQNFQRIAVVFTVPKGKHATTTLELIGGPGSGTDTVQFTDVGVQIADGATPTGQYQQAGPHYYTENFEHPIGGGFGPFVIGQPSEPSEILSETNPGYTRDTISGKYSLETINNGSGLQFRTWPGSLRFQPGHAYRVRVDYQSDRTGLYTFQATTDESAAPIVDLPLAQTTNRGLTSSPPPGPSPAGWTDSLPPQYSAAHASLDTTFVTPKTGETYLALVQTTNALGAATLDNLIVDDLGPAPAADAGSALATLTAGPTQLPGGKTSAVTVSFTNHSKESMTNVTLSLASAAGWTVTPTSATTATSVSPRATVRATYDVAVRAKAAAGDNVLTAHANYTWNGHRTSQQNSINASSVYSSLAAAFNNVGITDNAATTAGNFDRTDSYSAQSLAAAGATPGARITHDKVSFSWPNVAAGQADNVVAQGQTIALPGTGEIALLGSSGGTGYGTVTVSYSDGSTSQAQLGLPNWCCTAANGHGAQVAITAPGNNGPHRTGADYHVYYNTIPTDQTKTVTAVTLPSDPALHIFAMSIKTLVPAPPTTTVYASDLQWTGSTNGWGPVERDHSNGEDLTGDGNAITMNGTGYAKGLGTVPVTPGTIDINLGGNCTSLTATIGLDDEELNTGGSVGFVVLADGVPVYRSGVFKSGSIAQNITVALAGAHTVELQTTDGGDGIGDDHGDWANAQFHCG